MQKRGEKRKDKVNRVVNRMHTSFMHVHRHHQRETIAHKPPKRWYDEQREKKGEE